MAKRASAGPSGGAAEEVDYASALFGQFCAKLRAFEEPEPLLDLGPSTTSNVMYWVGAGHSVSAFDIMSHATDEDIRLDHEDATFGGVLGWTALSHLEPAQARQLVREIRRVLRPNGWMFAVFDGDGRKEPVAQRYRIIDSKTLGFAPVAGRTAPRAVSTGEVELLFQPFREVRIMVMRHGAREALGRRP